MFVPYVRSRVLLLGLAAWLAARGSGAAAAQAPAASFCPTGGASDSTLPDPAQVAPVALAPGSEPRAFRYAFTSGGEISTAALVGISHEYTCHIDRASGKVHPELAR